MFDRNAYNRQYYAELKRQDKRILEAAIRMRKTEGPYFAWDKMPKAYQEMYIRFATAVLYPERLKND